MYGKTVQFPQQINRSGKRRGEETFIFKRHLRDIPTKCNVASFLDPDLNQPTIKGHF